MKEQLVQKSQIKIENKLARPSSSLYERPFSNALESSFLVYYGCGKFPGTQIVGSGGKKRNWGQMRGTGERGEETSSPNPRHFFCASFTSRHSLLSEPGTDLGNERTLSSWEKHQTQVSYLQILS